MGKIQSYLHQVFKVIKIEKSKKNSFFLFLDIVLCSIIFGASPNNYHYFGFVNKNFKSRKTFVTHRTSNKIIKKFNNPKYIDIFEKKEVFNTRFKKYISRSFLNLNSYTDDDFNNFYYEVRDQQKVIYKPSENAQGQGIIVIHFNSKEELLNAIKGLDKNAVLEQWIKQNGYIDKIYDKSVNCLRIITLFNNNKTHFLACNFTFGNEGGEIANASLNNLVCLPDLKNGIVTTNAQDINGDEYECHPY